MKWPNVYKGIKNIFIAEILEIVGSVIELAALLFLDTLFKDFSNNGALIGTGLSIIVISVITIISLIVYLVGLVQARREEREFHLALVVTIIALVIEIASAFLEPVHPDAAGWLEFAFEILELVAFESVVSGVVNIAKEVGDEKILSIGKKMRILVTAIWIFMLIIKLLELFAADIAEIVKIVYYVLEIIDHIFYVILLYKGRKMIAEASAISSN